LHLAQTPYDASWGQREALRKLSTLFHFIDGTVGNAAARAFYAEFGAEDDHTGLLELDGAALATVASWSEQRPGSKSTIRQS
jgi:hypothetical protein